MKGIASVVLIIDRSCNLLNFAVVKIIVSDKKKENILGFSDSDVFEKLSENRFEIFKKDYYPLYVQALYDQLTKNINKLQIEYSSDKKI